MYVQRDSVFEVLKDYDNAIANNKKAAELNPKYLPQFTNLQQF